MAFADPISAAALLISALLLTWLLVVRRRRLDHGATHSAESELLDTVQAWPPQVVRVMTLHERLAYGTLCRALPRHMVLSQVPLSRFISVPSGRSYAQWLTRAGRLSVDLLVCDSSSRVIAAIEVRPAQVTPSSADRHQRLINVLKAAGVTVLVWNEAALPTTAMVRQLFAAKDGMTAKELEELGDGDRRFLPVPEIQEVHMDAKAFSYDASNEPVPSGYFDELDAAAAARARSG